MATFFGGLQLSRIFTVDSTKDAAENGMKPIYTVPSGKFAVVQLTNTIYRNNAVGYTECYVYQDFIETSVNYNDPQNNNVGIELKLSDPNRALIFSTSEGETYGTFNLPENADFQKKNDGNNDYIESAGLWSGGVVTHRWSINNGSNRTSKIRIIVFEYDLP